MIEYNIKGVNSKGYLIDSYISIDNEKRIKIAIANNHYDFIKDIYDIYDISDKEFKEYFKPNLKDKINNIINR